MHTKTYEESPVESTAWAIPRSGFRTCGRAVRGDAINRPRLAIGRGSELHVVAVIP